MQMISVFPCGISVNRTEEAAEFNDCLAVAKENLVWEGQRDDFVGRVIEEGNRGEKRECYF